MSRMIDVLMHERTDGGRRSQLRGVPVLEDRLTDYLVMVDLVMDRMSSMSY